MTAQPREPVAWMTTLDMGKGGRGPIFTTSAEIAEKWREAGEVAPLYAAPAPPVAQPAEPPATDDLPTMDDAIAAGDGTLHGAIDYWQGVAQRQAREIARLTKARNEWMGRHRSTNNLRKQMIERAERAEAERDEARELADMNAQKARDFDRVNELRQQAIIERDALREVVRDIVDAYEQRFGRGGNYVGPIDREVNAARAKVGNP